ncbi:hypothetical protein Trydic_g982 [Trypoxylus dichotomus]
MSGNTSQILVACSREGLKESPLPKTSIQGCLPEEGASSVEGDEASDRNDANWEKMTTWRSCEGGALEYRKRKKTKRCHHRLVGKIDDGEECGS